MRINKFLRNFLFPVKCLGCQKEGTFLCPECLEKIPFLPYYPCPKCLKPSLFGGICLDCGKSRFPISRLIVATSYKNELVASLIKQFKFYPFSLELANPLAVLLVKTIKESGFAPYLKQKNFIIVPVPLLWRDKAKRGFNQSEELAKIMAKNFNLSLNTNIVKKTKKTNPQIGLGKEERKKNLKESFKTKTKINGNFLIVDDIITTGSTLREVAKTLKKAGANEIWAAVLAKA